MITDRLVINGFEIELSKDMIIPLNIAIADFRDPEKRQRTFSKVIEIEGTAQNCAVFASAYSYTVTDDRVNFDATRKLPSIYEKKGVPIMPKAITQLVKVTINDGQPTFSIRLFSDVVDWFLLLQGIKINELDWSTYDHTLTLTNIKNSWTATAGSGYLYPCIEFGNQRPSQLIWRTVDFIPYVYMREVVVKLLEFADISHDSIFLDSSFLKKFVFGYGGGQIKTLSPTDLNDRIIEVDSGTFNHSITVNPQPISSNYFNGDEDDTFKAYFNNDNIIDSSVITYSEVQDNLNQFDNFSITVQRTGNYLLELNMAFDWSYDVGSMTWLSSKNPSLNIRKNGSVIFNTIYNGGQSVINEQSGTESFLLSKNLYLQSGDVITFDLEIALCQASTAANVSPDPVTFNITNTTDTTLDFNCIDQGVNDGSLISLNQFLPPMKGSDFLIGFFRQFYMFANDPDTNNTIKLEPLVDFYQGTDQTDDISELIDESKPIEMIPSANEYPKETEFKFQDGKEYDHKFYLDKWGEKYGNFTLEQGSYFAKGKKTIQLPWGTIVPYEVSEGILIPRFIDYESNGNNVKKVDGAPRIMIWNGMKDGNIQIRNFNAPYAIENLTQYPCVHHFDDWENPSFDLNFKLVNEVFYSATKVTTENSFSRYYEEFINEMLSPAGKFVRAYVKWNSVEVKNIDFSLLRLINGAVFRLNNITDFDEDNAASAKTEFIKVIKAKNIRRNSLTVGNTQGVFENAGISVDPEPPVGGGGGVGIDVGVSNGGLTSVLFNSKLKKG